MFVEKLSELSAWGSKVVEVVWMLFINTLTVPLSLLYTSVSKVMDKKWQLSDIPGIGYLWWSYKDKLVKFTGNGATEAITKAADKHPKLFMVFFVVIAVPFIIIAAVKMAAQAIKKAANESKGNAVVDVEEIRDATPVATKRKRKGKRSESTN